MSKAIGTPKKLTVKGVAIAVAIASAGYVYKSYFDGSATSFVGPAAAEGELDTSRLPRAAGGKEIYVSAPTTIFVSPDPVAATAEATAKRRLATTDAQGLPPLILPARGAGLRPQPGCPTHAARIAPAWRLDADRSITRQDVGRQQGRQLPIEVLELR